MGILTVNSDFEKLYGSIENMPYNVRREYLKNSYFTIEVLDDEEITDKTITVILYTKVIPFITYRINKGNWVVKEQGTNINVKRGDIVEFKGNMDYSYYTDEAQHSDIRTFVMYSNCKVNVYGNILSLFYGSDMIEHDKLYFEHACDQMFNYNSNYFLKIVDASNLILPSRLSPHCYSGMFKYITTLTVAPEINNTSSAVNNEYFAGMFRGCSNLNYIKFTGIYKNGNFSNWVNGVGQTGTFVKNFSEKFPTGVHGIPSGWTVIDLNCEPTKSISFTPNSGNIYSGDNIALMYGNNNNEVTGIKYTLDGTDPTVNGIEYEDYINITEEGTLTIKAVAYNYANNKYYYSDIYTANYTVLPEPMKIYVDKFPEINVEDPPYWEDAGYNTRDEFIAAVIEEPYENGCDVWRYSNDTLEYDGNEYYVWTVGGNNQGGSIPDAFLLTTTDNYETLYGESLEEDILNEFSSLYGYTFTDDMTEGYIQEDLGDDKKYLVKVVNNTTNED